MPGQGTPGKRAMGVEGPARQAEGQKRGWQESTLYTSAKGETLEVSTGSL